MRMSSSRSFGAGGGVTGWQVEVHSDLQAILSQLVSRVCRHKRCLLQNRGSAFDHAPGGVIRPASSRKTANCAENSIATSGNTGPFQTKGSREGAARAQESFATGKWGRRRGCRVAAGRAGPLGLKRVTAFGALLPRLVLGCNARAGAAVCISGARFVCQRSGEHVPVCTVLRVLHACELQLGASRGQRHSRVLCIFILLCA